MSSSLERMKFLLVMERWVAKLLVWLLDTATRWVRIQTSIKNYKMGYMSKEVARPTYSSPQKIYKKNLFEDISALLLTE
jgi:hypothetical protein